MSSPMITWNNGRAVTPVALIERVAMRTSAAARNWAGVRTTSLALVLEAQVAHQPFQFRFDDLTIDRAEPTIELQFTRVAASRTRTAWTVRAVDGGGRARRRRATPSTA